MDAGGVLTGNLGLFTVAEFWLGDGRMVTRQGTLETVGEGWFVLRNREEGTLVVCDIDALRFLTFFQPEAREPR